MKTLSPKTQKFLLGIVLCGFLGIGIFLGYSHLQKYVFSENVKIVFLQIDRGDSTYIRTPHHKEIIIDGGQNLSTLVALQRHRPFWDRHLDLLIITHPDSDHYYGFLEVLKRFDVDTLMVTGGDKSDKKYQEILHLAKQKNVNIVYADQSRDFSVDGVNFDILFPLESILGTKKVGNNFGLVIKMEYQKKPEISGKSILFTGDIEKKTEEVLLASGKNVHADILKVPHHGSKSSSSEYFLSAVNPERAVFTTGTKNQFGHPHQQVLERYQEFNIPFENSRDGDVVIEWD